MMTETERFISADGKYPKPRDRFEDARCMASLAILAVLYVSPWVCIYLLWRTF